MKLSCYNSEIDLSIREMNAVTNVTNEMLLQAISELSSQFNTMKTDIVTMKDDIATLKEEVLRKGDVFELKKVTNSL